MRKLVIFPLTVSMYDTYNYRQDNDTRFDIFQERRLSVGKIDNNKQMKRESLLDSAFSLFIDNGFNKTSISDIVNNAGVAKGTFYLYFKDKYDIRNHLIAHKASQIFQAAYADLLRHPDIQDFEEQVLFITEIGRASCRERV